MNVTDDAVVPMTTLEVIDALRTGKLSEQSLVWRIGMHDWTPVLDVPQLRLAAGSRPPPPRPASVQVSEAALESNRFSPVPPLAAPLALEAAQSGLPSSLAPTTAEAEASDRARAPGAWDIEELLSNERRADQKSSRRVVFWAALGAAALAAVFTLLLLRSPARHAVAPIVEAARPTPEPEVAPEPAATLGAITPPSASAPEPAASPSAPQRLAPRFARRPKRAAPASDSSLASPSPAASASAAASVAVVPLAPLDPAPTASTATDGPPPSTPSSP